MKVLLLLYLLAVAPFSPRAAASGFEINSLSLSGQMSWSNAFFRGICTIQTASQPDGPWASLKNYFTTNSLGRAQLSISGNNTFFRLLAVDVSTNNPQGYTNLLNAYGFLHTIAGNGFGGVDGVNYWQPSFEGDFATNATLSRPHFAMADDAGDVFVVDKDSHSVLKISTDGRIHTVAGTHAVGNGSDSPAPGTTVALSSPNGLWVRSDGRLYVLDTGNGKIRRLDTNGSMLTLFAVTGGITGGRGLWVKDDESLAYFADGGSLKKWSPLSGVKTLNSNFTDLGNFIVQPDGDIIATDRGENKVYLVDATGGNAGSRTKIAGDGSTNIVVEGTLAKANGLYGVRGVWPVPTGGYLLATHEGSQILFMDAAGIIRIFVNGTSGNAHGGDGQWFHMPGNKVSEVRSVTMDSQGNVLITENDFGYIRQIDFARLTP